MKYFIITYGCQMNKSDSERIAAFLENKGYKPASGINEADLIVVNMCSVRQSAVDRVYGLLPKFKKLKALPASRQVKTVLTGCILKEDRKKFRKVFDFIWNTETRSHYEPGSHRPKYQTSFRAYLPIITGCSNFCSYCVVPFVRGPEASRPVADILCEVKNLVKRGYKEIWLLGENVNSYLPLSFPELLRKINAVPGDFWIRFTSPHPKDFSDELIETIAECEKVTEYINLPVQSGDDQILKKMRRPYRVKDYKKLTKKIRKKIPEVCLSTDVIVGFPGETKKQFQNTLKLFEETKFDMAYIAQYSPRPGTTAAKMKDDVPHQEKERRDKALTKVLKQAALRNNKKYIGEIVEVLAEKRKKGFLIGKTRTYKTIKFEGSKNLIGQFTNVKVVDALPWGLKGKLLN